jgi:sugar/nucleoside kinase (ribokinase family)
MRTADVVVVGNAGLDTEVFLPGDSIDLSLDSQFTSNRDVVGQAGGYAARGFARLGRATRYFGALGEDAAGRAVRRALASDGVLLDLVFADPQGTARSVNLMTRDGRRRAFYDGRGHLTQTVPNGLIQLALQDVPLAHIHLANWARGALLPSIGTVAVDLQDVRDLDDEYRADFVAGADIVFMSGAHLPDPPAAAQEVVHRGKVQVAVVGLGAAGALAVVRGGQVRHYPVPPLDLPVVDSNGAGDSLAVGFLDAYVLDGTDLAEAVLRGQVAARWACTEPGSDHLIARDRLLELAALGRSG